MLKRIKIIDIDNLLCKKMKTENWEKFWWNSGKTIYTIFI